MRLINAKSLVGTQTLYEELMKFPLSGVICKVSITLEDTLNSSKKLRKIYMEATA